MACVLQPANAKSNLSSSPSCSDSSSSIASSSSDAAQTHENFCPQKDAQTVDNLKPKADDEDKPNTPVKSGMKRSASMRFGELSAIDGDEGLLKIETRPLQRSGLSGCLDDIDFLIGSAADAEASEPSGSSAKRRLVVPSRDAPTGGL